MVIGIFYQEASDVLSGPAQSLSKAIPTLIIIMLLIAILYWLRSLQRKGRTEIRVYRRP